MTRQAIVQEQREGEREESTGHHPGTGQGAANKLQGRTHSRETLHTHARMPLSGPLPHHVDGDVLYGHLHRTGSSVSSVPQRASGEKISKYFFKFCRFGYSCFSLLKLSLLGCWIGRDNVSELLLEAETLQMFFPRSAGHHVRDMSPGWLSWKRPSSGTFN